MCKLNPDYGRNTSSKFDWIRALPGTIVSAWHRILSGFLRWRAHKIKCRGTGLLIKSVKLLIKAQKLDPQAEPTQAKPKGIDCVYINAQNKGSRPLNPTLN